MPDFKIPKPGEPGYIPPVPFGKLPDEPTSPADQMEAALRDIQYLIETGTISFEEGQARLGERYEAITAASVQIFERTEAAEFTRKRDEILRTAKTYGEAEAGLADLANTDPFYRRMAAADPAAFWNNLRSMALEQFPEELKAARERVAPAWAGEARRRAEAREQIYREPRFEPAFEEMRVGVEKPWRDWFESRYGRELARFKAGRPTDLVAEEEEERWRAYLKQRRPELYEEFYARPPYERGERPSYFAPKIRTVRF